MENLNMSTHEVYCSLDICKLLKEAGFDWEGTAYYQHGVFYPYSVDRERLVVMNQSSAPSYMEQYSAPTLEVAQRWLREVKQCYVQVYPMFLFNGTLKYYFVEVIYTYSRNIKQNEFKTYEEAQEAGIKKALEIILEKGE